MFNLKDVKKYYKGRLVLDISSLDIKKGELYAVYGPNGSGKTTLLNMLSFHETPCSGELILSGGVYNTANVTLVMQDPYFFNTTVQENISMGLVFRSVEKDRIMLIIRPVMEQLGVWDMRDRSINALSGGEKKRVALARALVIEPEVLLLDEVTSDTDSMYAGVIQDMILSEIKKRDMTVVMATHDLRQAYHLTDKVIYLLNGKITGSPLCNIFRVMLDGQENEKQAKLGGNTGIVINTLKTGRVSISIDPRGIIVSRSKLESSALNNIKGRIATVNEMNDIIDLVIDVGVSLHVYITHRSLNEMMLSTGMEVYVSFKASAMEVF